MGAGQAWRQRRASRLAMVSVHTSPLDQPGTGDAGGMNVYIVETARRLAERGVGVEVFTRATSSAQPPIERLADGVLVRHVTAGPFEGLAKDELPGQVCAFAAEMLRIEAAHPPGWYDLLHSHYWISGQAAAQVARRWDVPLVHTMHTMAKVKNASLAAGERPEPAARVLGEEEVIAASDRLTANTATEAAELADLYGAPSDRVAVVPPGVDLAVFAPGDRDAARARLGLPRRAHLVLFVGRLQPLKGPDVLINAVAELLLHRPWLREDLVVAVLGGPSGSGTRHPEEIPKLAANLGLGGVVRFEPPSDRHTLADWYRAADLVAVPSHSESFGLVAVEAQACGTPVLAAAVGGLPTAVRNGITGHLVSGHQPGAWARALGRLLDQPQLLRRMGASAAEHASGLSWDATVDRLLAVYRDAARARFAERRADLQVA